VQNLYAATVVFVFVLASDSQSPAIEPFMKAFRRLYVVPETPLEARFDEARCNVCHIPGMKEIRNDYGIAVGKYLKKADFVGAAKKFDSVKGAEARKAMEKGLLQAAGEKSFRGSLFRELIKAGKLPAADE
jgi:hypothetical protein